MMIDDASYGLGYDAGFQEGKSFGYTEGWEDATADYDLRAAKLQVRIETLEALLHSLAKGD